MNIDNYDSIDEQQECYELRNRQQELQDTHEYLVYWHMYEDDEEED